MDSLAMRSRIRLSKGTVLAVLMLASVGTTLLGPRMAAALRRPCQVVLAPLSDAGYYLSSRARSAGKDLMADEISQDQARKDKQVIENLRAAQQSLLHQLDDYHVQLAKVQKLSALAFGPAPGVPCELIFAKIVSADSLTYGQTRLVRAESQAGKSSISAGQAVTMRQLMTDRANDFQQPFLAIGAQWELNSTVLVGRLTDSWAFGGRLELVTDRGFYKVPAKVLRIYDPAKPRQIRDGAAYRPLAANDPPLDIDVSGDGLAGLTAQNIKEEYAIREGDWIVTRSDEPLLPAQIKIGEVVEVRPRHAGFVDLRIKPAADLDTLRDVYIVVPHVAFGADAYKNNLRGK